MLYWRDIKRMSAREILLQLLLLLLIVFIILGAISSAKTNLSTLGITSGFGFLDRSTGWAYSFSLIERSIDDPYYKTLLIGFLNTLFVGSISIVFATILGFIVGTMRDSVNIGLQVVSSLYVQVFRNIPLILQIVFLYSILIHFPSPRQAHALFDSVFLSNRGIMVPLLTVPMSVVAVCAALSLFTAVLLFKFMRSVWKALLCWLLISIVILGIAVVLFTPVDAQVVSYPQLKGLRFVGGMTVSVELVAMILGIVLYGAAYIAEVVRGGLAEVPAGLSEAGDSMGMSRFAVWWTIKVPMALRSIIPPLGNQWIFIMKATTVGVAIGFSDLFYIVSTSITQSGQTLELIGIMMLAFLLINFSLARAVNWLNNKLALKGYG